MEPHRITESEKNKMTDSACEQFKTRNPAFFPCAANAEKLVGFVEKNLGMTLAEYPYPVGVQVWQDSYDYLLQNDFFYARPEEPEVEDPEQQRALEEANANLAAAKANETRVAKNVPLRELRDFVGVTNAKLREARDRGESPDRPAGQSSRPISTVKLGDKAQARINVATAHPEITDRNGAAFMKLYAAELARLRG